MKKVGSTMNNNMSQPPKMNGLNPITQLPVMNDMNTDMNRPLNTDMNRPLNTLIPHLPRMTKTVSNTPYMSNSGPNPLETFLAEASYLNNYNNMNNFYNMNRIATAGTYRKKRKRR